MNVAALDCGSNSTRLLILSSSGEALVRETTITRLSAGVDATGHLSDEAMQRSFATLERYRALMDAHDVTRARLVATSAVRDADNGADFLEGAARRTGAAAAVITGFEEARLSYDGATRELGDDDDYLVLDIGGGSTEMCARVAGEVVGFSMQLGCVRVSERALGSGVVDADARERARAMIDAEIDRALAATPGLAGLVGRARLIGLAGSVSTLVSLVRHLEHYERRAVHHQVVTRDEVTHWVRVLGAETPAQRLAQPGMVSGREDVIVAGLMVLEAVMERFGVERLLSSESDILDGVAWSLLDPDETSLA